VTQGTGTRSYDGSGLVGHEYHDPSSRVCASVILKVHRASIVVEYLFSMTLLCPFTLKIRVVLRSRSSACSH
jgi:hypothetical protein